MKPVLTADEYGRVDRAYEGDLGRAMERAGHAVALAAVRHGAVYGKRVAVLAGPGNNGGDGYVAARHLHARGVTVTVHALAEPATDLAKAAADGARAEGVPIVPLAIRTEVDLVVDALFGGRGHGGLPEQVLEWMETPAPVIAVDYPTGLDPNTGAVPERAFVAVETVTFGALKTSHVRGRGPDHCGMVTVADIGISGGEPSMFVAEETDAPRPARSRTAHKWSAGSVLVVGGSAGLVGASVLAGSSALGFGAGSVYVASPRPDLVTQVDAELPTVDFDDAGSLLDRFDVVLAGPGLGEDDLADVEPLLSKAAKVVLDAGALRPELVQAAKDGGASVIATPHAGEFNRIAGRGGGAFSTRSYARSNELVLLFKGNPTLITDGGLPILVTTGGPELASIGTGDVLAGMIAALWARGLDPLAAAISGAYWHGVAGKGVVESEGTLTAMSLATAIRELAW